MNDYHRSVLGVTRDASREEIKRAYRRLMRQYHPDVNPAEEARTRFRQVREAYEVLSRAEPEPIPLADPAAASAAGGADPVDFRDAGAGGLRETPEESLEVDVRKDFAPGRRSVPRKRKWRRVALLVIFLLTGVWTASGWFQDLFAEPRYLVLTHGGREWKLDLNQAGYNGKDPSTVDERAVAGWLKQVGKQVNRPARDAFVKRWGQPVRPEKAGRVMDSGEIRDKWLPRVDRLVNKPQPIPMVEDRPLVTRGDLARVGKKRLSTYTTYFKSGNPDRSRNIRLSAQAVNNRILNPGDIFSFNGTVGKRTAERGYRPVPRRMNGEFSEGVGGGVSQTSSTLFNSVDAAGLETVYRFSFSRDVTYVPRGRDATVSWNMPDYQFRNNLKEPILIKSRIGKDSLTVEIFSTPEAKAVPRAIPPAPDKLPDEVDTDPENPSDELDPAQFNNRVEDRSGKAASGGSDGGTEAGSSTGGSNAGETTGGSSSGTDGGSATGGRGSSDSGADTGTDPGGDDGSDAGNDTGDTTGEDPTGGDTDGTTGGDDGTTTGGDDAAGGDSGTDPTGDAGQDPPEADDPDGAAGGEAQAGEEPQTGDGTGGQP